MKTTKRLMSLLLILILIFSLSSCKSDKEKDGGKQVNGKKVSATDVTLPYSREDGVNPFTAQSLVNWTIMPLMYESPVTLDSNYKPVPCIASEFSEGEDSVTIKLSDKKRFSDGSPVTGNDIVYSFNLAKDSPFYRTALKSIESATSEFDGTVRFKLKKSNVFSAADLVFPVVKSGTAAEEMIPVGSGRYVYKRTEGGGMLEMNTGSGWSGFHTKTIHLINESSSDSLLYSLSIGNVDAVFENLAGGSPQRIVASTVQVPLNNLVIVDIKPDGVFKDPENRQALDSVIDRTKLISAGMDGYGVVSRYPFNPKWYGVKKKLPGKMEKKEASERLKNKCRGRKYTILTNKDNDYKVKTAEALSIQLKSAGVETEVSALPYDDYSKAAESGRYDFCIKEYKLTGDMDISFLVKGDEPEEIYSKVLSGKAPYEEFAKFYYGEMPFVTIGFRNGVLAYTRNIKGDVKVLPDNPLSNVENWNMA